MIKVAFVRGRFLNNFEGQNYIFSPKTIQLTGISSIKPIDQKFSFPTIRLFSLADFGVHPILERGIKILGNRVLGDNQILFGLERLASQFDIFHSADLHYYYTYQLAKLRSLNKIKRLIVTSWETIPFNNETIKKKLLIKKFSQKQVDLFICHTEKARNCLIKEGVFNKKIRLIRLGVDLIRFKPKSKQKKDTLTILFVGRFVEEKGVIDLYQSFKILLNCKPKSLDLKLILIGQGPLKKILENLVKKDQLNNKVSFITRSYEYIHQDYQNADIFVLPSKKTKTWEEQYGMVLVEAMASGLPIIAYNTGVISEIVGQAGLLVKENQLEELQRTMKILIENEKLRIKIGKMGRERAEKFFDRKKTAQKIEKIYFQLI